MSAHVDLITFGDSDYYYHDGSWWMMVEEEGGIYGLEMESTPWVLH